jgi:glycolate oxidase FAD binding subunit
MGASQSSQDWILLVGWEGFSEDVRRLIREGQETISRFGLREEGIYESNQAEKGWEILGHLDRYLAAEEAEVILCRISVPPAEAGKAIGKWLAEAAGSGCRQALLVRTGSGILYGYFLGPGEGDEKCARALQNMREWAGGEGGGLIIERAPLWLKRGMDVWGDRGNASSLMKGLKKHFDPLEILNPGRYVGGI